MDKKQMVNFVGHKFKWMITNTNKKSMNMKVNLTKMEILQVKEFWYHKMAHLKDFLRRGKKMGLELLLIKKELDFKAHIKMMLNKDKVQYT